MLNYISGGFTDQKYLVNHEIDWPQKKNKMFHISLYLIRKLVS